MKFEIPRPFEDSSDIKEVQRQIRFLEVQREKFQKNIEIIFSSMINILKKYPEYLKLVSTSDSINPETYLGNHDLIEYNLLESKLYDEKLKKQDLERKILEIRFDSAIELLEKINKTERVQWKLAKQTEIKGGNTDTVRSLEWNTLFDNAEIKIFAQEIKVETFESKLNQVFDTIAKKSNLSEEGTAFTKPERQSNIWTNMSFIVSPKKKFFETRKYIMQQAFDFPGINFQLNFDNNTMDINFPMNTFYQLDGNNFKLDPKRFERAEVGLSELLKKFLKNKTESYP